MERFDWLAGEQLASFGYARTGGRFSATARVRHTVQDWQWRTRTGARLLVYGLRTRVALRTRLARTLALLHRGAPPGDSQGPTRKRS